MEFNQPFSGSFRVQNMKKVKLRRFPGWLEIGGKNYAIEKDVSKTVNQNLSFNESVVLEDIKKSLVSIRKGLADRVELLTNGKNLFVEQDDTKVMKKQADKRMKRLEELEVKMAGLGVNA